MSSLPPCSRRHRGRNLQDQNGAAGRRKFVSRLWRRAPTGSGLSAPRGSICKRARLFSWAAGSSALQDLQGPRGSVLPERQDRPGPDVSDKDRIFRSGADRGGQEAGRRSHIRARCRSPVPAFWVKSRSPTLGRHDRFHSGTDSARSRQSTAPKAAPSNPSHAGKERAMSRPRLGGKDPPFPAILGDQGDEMWFLPLLPSKGPHSW